MEPEDQLSHLEHIYSSKVISPFELAKNNLLNPHL